MTGSLFVLLLFLGLAVFAVVVTEAVANASFRRALLAPLRQWRGDDEDQAPKL